MAASVNLETLEIQSLDHHGLVASVIEECGLVKLLDKHLPLSKEKGAIVTHGQRTAAMIINGLGFTANPLYLSPQFFEDKPVSRLIGEGIKAEHLNDDALGRTLDAIYQIGCTQLFAEVAFNIASKQSLFGQSAKLDTTSLKLFGKYYQVSEKDGMKPPQPALGHSKDHRPDLKQVVMSLIVSGSGNIPLWFEGLNGNSQDKKSFHETIERVRTFQKQLQDSPSFLWVADAALYSQGKLKESGIRYLTRVPATLKRVKNYCHKDKNHFTWEELGSGYRSVWVDSNEPKRERWLLIYSEQAATREKDTLGRRLKKSLIQAELDARKLKAIPFACKKDAKQAAEKFEKKLKYHGITFDVIAVHAHSNQGRPKRNKKPELKHYQLNMTIEQDDVKWEPYNQQAGRFVLGSNDLTNKKLTAAVMLNTYKEQQGVEQGFRFIKEPCFHLSQVFLKKPERIEALMMIMTLCLLIYNLGQHQLRQGLKEQGETLPGQNRQPIRNPTMRWVFQMMKAIHIVHYPGAPTLTSGLNDNKQKIIRLFGDEAVRIYGLK